MPTKAPPPLNGPCTSAFVAACNGNATILEYLVGEAQANPNKGNTATGQTPLHAACRFDHAGCVSVLLEYGADPNARDGAGRTALQVAAALQHAEGLAALLGAPASAQRRRCDPDLADPATGDGALHSLARAAEHPAAADMLRVLLRHGADPCLLNTAGESALLLGARRPGGHGVVQQLVEAGADPNVQADGLALVAAGECGREAEAEVEAGPAASAGPTAPAGRTVLQLVVAVKGLEECGRLLRHGADTEAADAAGETALLLAVRVGDVGCANALLEAGCGTSACNAAGESALALALAEQHPGLVSLLLRAGADPCARNADGASRRVLPSLSPKSRRVRWDMKFECRPAGRSQAERR